MTIQTTTRTIYLACDLQEGNLVTRHEYTHWADAYVAAISGGNAALERDATGYMRAVEDGREVYVGGSFADQDAEAKDEAGKAISRHMRDYREDWRYSMVEITIDAEGLLVVDRDDETGNALLDAATYGRAAGYELRPQDAARLGE